MRHVSSLALMLVFTANAAADPALRPIPEVAARAGSFRTLLSALDREGLTSALDGEGPFTVFAPTDEAFAALAALPATGLREVLLGHVASGRLDGRSLLAAGTVRTLAGTDLEVAKVDGVLTVGGSRVRATDVEARNGLIHVLDGVILPSAPRPARGGVLDVLEAAVARGAPLYNEGNVEACAAVYETAARAILTLAGEELAAEDRADLEGGLAEAASKTEARERAWALRRAFDRIFAREEKRDMKTDTDLPRDPEFRVRVEAALPEGFPAPGPVGEIVRKEYPRYRLARTAGGTAFWTLFRHIQSNGISMTAPVEMTMEEQADGLHMVDMAFLYGTPGMGRAGSEGAVRVLDGEPATVLSVGLAGRLSRELLERAKEALLSRLAKSPDLERAGDFRLLGYNSPMIPERERFHELQLPVRRVGK